MEKKKILVVEDNDDNRKVIKVVLTHSGFDVIENKDGTEVIKTVLREKPDLILMDIQLPGIDGYQLTKKLKTMEETRGIFIIAITANAMEEDKLKAFAAGCDGYIAKPINTRDLPREIKKFVRQDA